MREKGELYESVVVDGRQRLDGMGWGREQGKGHVPGARLGIYGGTKTFGGEIVTPNCMCARTCIHIHNLV